MGLEGLDRKLDMEGVNMPELAKALELGLFRPVIDRTGLTGTFDVHMHWTLDSSAGFASAPNEPVPAPGATNLGGSSIVTTIQEQLGLKLESAKGPVDVLVIDHVEKPTEN